MPSAQVYSVSVRLFPVTRKLYQAELPRDRKDSQNDPEIKIAGNGFPESSFG